MPIALTIAGSDSSGGAGIQADLKTFTSYKVFGASVITSITAQNTVSITSIEDISIDSVEEQIDSVLGDIGADSVKTGMLCSSEVVLLVSRRIKKYKIRNLVVDPVMRSKVGVDLLKPTAVNVLKNDLLPLAMVITPNIDEAEILSGIKIENVEDMKRAALKLKELGPRWVVVKGGHLKSNDNSIDIVFDGERYIELKAERIFTENTHGTGCTFSAAICAGLAMGNETMDSIRSAKNYINGAIANSFDIGKGHGPLNHFWKI
ncbi:MAG: bifunctional hydroxymethylpyrimidine kinase/phosphomethylpyrimidine kinase [Thermodesulfobacteriota bacterium]